MKIWVIDIFDRKGYCNNSYMYLSDREPTEEELCKLKAQYAKKMKEPIAEVREFEVDGITFFTEEDFA